MFLLLHRTWWTFVPTPPEGVLESTSYRFPVVGLRMGGSSLALTGKRRLIVFATEVTDMG